MSDHRAAFPPSASASLSAASAASIAGAHSGDGGEAPPSEAALRALRQGRAETAQRIGEHLYRMIMGGLLHDPAVIAACRPLYEMEQQILRMEAALGTSGVGASPLTQTALPVVAASSSSSSSSSSPPAAMTNRDEMSTAITPGQRPAWQSGPPAGASSGDHAEDASHTSSSSSSSSARHTHGGHGPHAADRLCGHCRMPLKATDRLCPVCGRDTADAVSLATTPAESTNCVRCHTVLRPHDHLCPVCGTARGG